MTYLLVTMTWFIVQKFTLLFVQCLAKMEAMFGFLPRLSAVLRAMLSDLQGTIKSKCDSDIECDIDSNES